MGEIFLHKIRKMFPRKPVLRQEQLVCFYFGDGINPSPLNLKRPSACYIFSTNFETCPGAAMLGTAGSDTVHLRPYSGVLRDYSWVWGTIWGDRDQIQVGRMQGQHPISYTISLTFPL